MGAFVLCGASWLVAALAAVRCRRTWRRGADQPWAPRWEALSATLWVTAFAVITILLLRLPVAPVYPAVVALLLALGAAVAAVAKVRSIRRSEAHVRAMRLGMGLPVARRLRHPATVLICWSLPSCAAAAAWLMVTPMRTGTRMMADGRWPALDDAFDTTVSIASVGVALGLVHAVIQIVRRDRDQHRVRTADREFLATGVTGDHDR